ncbi:MAG: hypothetical protein ACE5HV_12075 [Acidobacteriota bacterium]
MATTNAETGELLKDWPVSWEANRRDQLDRWLSATPAHRLEWLEEALALAFASKALPRRV